MRSPGEEEEPASESPGLESGGRGARRASNNSEGRRGGRGRRQERTQEEAAAAAAGVQEAKAWLRHVPDAPTYRPTLEEWAEPLAYIRSIQAEASRYGICKIVPPLSPDVPGGLALHLRDPSFRFGARVQQLEEVDWQDWDSGVYYESPRRYSLREFADRADEYARRRYGGLPAAPPASLVEAEYWAERAAAAKRKRADSVEYGGDLEGSAFAPPELAGADELARSKWNLSVLPRLPGSALACCIGIPGVDEPMLYVGQLFSTFAWHVEDHFLYAINYHHCGAPKTWYGVPARHAEGLERVARERVYAGACARMAAAGGSLAAQEAASLRTLMAKTTMFPPRLLLDAGVEVFRAVHEAGSFILTFPRAYHSGFSHGFCVGEAVNLGMGEWWVYGEDARLRYRRLAWPQVMPHERVLCEEALQLLESLGKPEGPGTQAANGPLSSAGELAAAGAALPRLQAAAAQAASDNVVMHVLVSTVQRMHHCRRLLQERGVSTVAAPAVQASRKCGQCRQLCYVCTVVADPGGEPTQWQHLCLECATSPDGGPKPGPESLLFVKPVWSDLERACRRFKALVKPLEDMRTSLGLEGLTERQRFPSSQPALPEPSEPYSWTPLDTPISSLSELEPNVLKPPQELVQPFMDKMMACMFDDTETVQLLVAEMARVSKEWKEQRVAQMQGGMRNLLGRGWTLEAAWEEGLAESPGDAGSRQHCGGAAAGVDALAGGEKQQEFEGGEAAAGGLFDEGAAPMEEEPCQPSSPLAEVAAPPPPPPPQGSDHHPWPNSVAQGATAPSLPPTYHGAVAGEVRVAPVQPQPVKTAPGRRKRGRPSKDTREEPLQAQTGLHIGTVREAKLPRNDVLATGQGPEASGAAPVEAADTRPEAGHSQTLQQQLAAPQQQQLAASQQQQLAAPQQQQLAAPQQQQLAAPQQQQLAAPQQQQLAAPQQQQLAAPQQQQLAAPQQQQLAAQQQQQLQLAKQEASGLDLREEEQPLGSNALSSLHTQHAFGSALLSHRALYAFGGGLGSPRRGRGRGRRGRGRGRGWGGGPASSQPSSPLDHPVNSAADKLPIVRDEVLHGLLAGHKRRAYEFNGVVMVAGLDMLKACGCLYLGEQTHKALERLLKQAGRDRPRKFFVEKLGVPMALLTQEEVAALLDTWEGEQRALLKQFVADVWPSPCLPPSNAAQPPAPFGSPAMAAPQPLQARDDSSVLLPNEVAHKVMSVGGCPQQLDESGPSATGRSSIEPRALCAEPSQGQDSEQTTSRQQQQQGGEEEEAGTGEELQSRTGAEEDVAAGAAVGEPQEQLQQAPPHQGQGHADPEDAAPQAPAGGSSSLRQHGGEGESHGVDDDSVGQGASPAAAQAGSPARQHRQAQAREWMAGEGAAVHIERPAPMHALPTHPVAEKQRPGSPQGPAATLVSVAPNKAERAQAQPPRKGKAYKRGTAAGTQEHARDAAKFEARHAAGLHQDGNPAAHGKPAPAGPPEGPLPFAARMFFYHADEPEVVSKPASTSGPTAGPACGTGAAPVTEAPTPTAAVKCEPDSQLGGPAHFASTSGKRAVFNLFHDEHGYEEREEEGGGGAAPALGLGSGAGLPAAELAEVGGELPEEEGILVAEPSGAVSPRVGELMQPPKRGRGRPRGSRSRGRPSRGRGERGGAAAAMSPRGRSSYGADRGRAGFAYGDPHTAAASSHQHRRPTSPVAVAMLAHSLPSASPGLMVPALQQTGQAGPASPAVAGGSLGGVERPHVVRLRFPKPAAKAAGAGAAALPLQPQLASCDSSDGQEGGKGLDKRGRPLQDPLSPTAKRAKLAAVRTSLVLADTPSASTVSEVPPSDTVAATTAVQQQHQHQSGSGVELETPDLCGPLPPASHIKKGRRSARPRPGTADGSGNTLRQQQLLLEGTRSPSFRPGGSTAVMPAGSTMGPGLTWGGAGPGAAQEPPARTVGTSLPPESAAEGPVQDMGHLISNMQVDDGEEEEPWSPGALAMASLTEELLGGHAGGQHQGDGTEAVAALGQPSCPAPKELPVPATSKGQHQPASVAAAVSGSGERPASSSPASEAEEDAATTSEQQEGEEEGPEEAHAGHGQVDAVQQPLSWAAARERTAAGGMIETMQGYARTGRTLREFMLRLAERNRQRLNVPAEAAPEALLDAFLDEYGQNGLGWASLEDTRKLFEELWGEQEAIVWAENGGQPMGEEDEGGNGSGEEGGEWVEEGEEEEDTEAEGAAQQAEQQGSEQDTEQVTEQAEQGNEQQPAATSGGLVEEGGHQQGPAEQPGEGAVLAASVDQQPDLQPHAATAPAEMEVAAGAAAAAPAAETRGAEAAAAPAPVAGVTELQPQPQAPPPPLQQQQPAAEEGLAEDIEDISTTAELMKVWATVRGLVVPDGDAEEGAELDAEQQVQPPGASRLQGLAPSSGAAGSGQGGPSQQAPQAQQDGSGVLQPSLHSGMGLTGHSSGHGSGGGSNKQTQQPAGAADSPAAAAAAAARPQQQEQQPSPSQPGALTALQHSGPMGFPHSHAAHPLGSQSLNAANLRPLLPILPLQPQPQLPPIHPFLPQLRQLQQQQLPRPPSSLQQAGLGGRAAGGVGSVLGPGGAMPARPPLMDIPEHEAPAEGLDVLNSPLFSNMSPMSGYAQQPTSPLGAAINAMVTEGGFSPAPPPVATQPSPVTPGAVPAPPLPHPPPGIAMDSPHFALLLNAAGSVPPGFPPFLDPTRVPTELTMHQQFMAHMHAQQALAAAMAAGGPPGMLWGGMRPPPFPIGPLQAQVLQQQQQTQQQQQQTQQRVGVAGNDDEDMREGKESRGADEEPMASPQQPQRQGPDAKQKVAGSKQMSLSEYMEYISKQKQGSGGP